MKERDVRLDLVRSFAILAVLIVHSFSFVELSAPQDFIRLIGLTGVPLFLILTGYLNQHKTMKDYYVGRKWRSCIRVLVAYVVLGSICFIVDRHFYVDKVLSLKAWATELLQFKLTPYGWYIEMWIGLFFLTPILNYIVKAMNEKEEKMIIVTLVCLSSLPAFLNRNGFSIVPNFWVNLYPIALYFCGVYLSKHTIKVRISYLLLLSALVLCTEPVLNNVMGGVKITHTI